MPTQYIQIGPPVTMAQNVVFALPARRCLLFCSTAAVTLFQASDVAFSDSVALTLSSGQAEVAGGFIRATNAAGAVVTLKTQ